MSERNGSRVSADVAARPVSDDRYRRLFEQTHDVVYISTPQGRLVDINRAGLELLDIGDKDELEEIDLARDLYVDPWERQRLRDKLAERGFVKDHELHLKTRLGRKLVVKATTTAVRDEDGEINAYLGILRDVTGQRQLEGKLRQTQKMAVVERITRGLSHEFNNLLTAINGYSDLLLHQLAESSGLRSYAEEIRDAGRRAAQLIAELSALSSRRAEAPLPIDLNRTVQHLETLLRRMIGEDVRLRVELERRLPRVRVDPAQLEQGLINLALNARDAMPVGGELGIVTSTVVLAPGEARPIGLEEGTYVLLRVRDTGIGIEKEAREEIFEPFYTTKEGGAGLGLATVYALVRQSEGAIDLRSEPGVGTEFRIYLPAVLEASPSPPRPAAGPGNEVILLVEDEPSVRQMIESLLRREGYRVLAAEDAPHALALLEERETVVDLLLSDVVMPGTSGPELATRLGRRRPGIKVLFMSGYGEDFTTRHGLDPGQPLLVKPFDPLTLTRRVRELLDS